MTWVVPPLGFIHDYFAAAADVTTTTTPPVSTVELDCPRTPEQIAIDGRLSDSTFVPQEFTGTATFPIAAAVAAISTGTGGFPDFRDGEFRFAIDLLASSTIGQVEGGYTACRTPPDNAFDPQFTGFADGHSHGDLDSGLQIVQYDTGAPISGSSVDDAFGFGLGGRLVNPAPSWPVPDAYGNTAGSTLWSLSELATAAAGISWDAYWVGVGSSAHIAMRVIITAYWLDGRLTQGFMCIV